MCVHLGHDAREEQEMAMKYGSEIPAVPTKELGKKQRWCFTASLTMGLLAWVSFSQFADWEVLVPEVSAFWPL